MQKETGHTVSHKGGDTQGQLMNKVDDGDSDKQGSPAPSDDKDALGSGHQDDSTSTIKRRNIGDSSKLKRPRDEEDDFENSQDGVSAAALANRSERKRSREKRRRSELNTGLDSLATLLYTIEPKLKSPLGAGKNSLSDEAEGQTAISNRVELINFTVKVMARLHEENEARKIVISDLTSAGAPPNFRDFNRLPGIGQGQRVPRSDLALSSAVSAQAFNADERRLAGAGMLRGKNNFSPHDLGADPGTRLPQAPGTVLSSSSAQQLPQETAAARERTLSHQHLMSMVEEEQLRLATMQQERQHSEQVNLPGLQQSLQILREQSLSSRLSGMRQGVMGHTGLPPDMMEALSLLQARGLPPGITAGAPGSILNPSAMMALSGRLGVGGLPDHLSPSFAMNELLSAGGFHPSASQLRRPQQRDGSGLPVGAPSDAELDMARTIMNARSAALGESSNDSTLGGLQTAPSWDPSAALFRAPRGRGRRGRPPPSA